MFTIKHYLQYVNNSHSYAKIFRHSAVLRLSVVLLRKVSYVKISLSVNVLNIEVARSGSWAP